MKKAVKIAVDIVLIAACVLALASFVFVAVVPWFIGAQRYVIVSESMAPAIARGDIVVVQPKSPLSYDVGDIVTFRQGGVITTHRVTAITDTGVMTKGDANVTEDFELILFQDIIGVMTYKIPYLGRISLAFKGE